MDSIPVPIQYISLIGGLIFMLFIARLITKGRLREEYSFIWIICTAILLLFSIWRNGLAVIAGWLGVAYPPSLIFLAAIFAVICFLVHLSVEVSHSRQAIKSLTQEIAFLKKQLVDQQNKASRKV